MTSLTSGRFQLPLNLTEGNTVDFVFRLSNNGTLFTPALTPVWIFGIKDADDPNGDFLIQVNSATAASGVFTFVVELASAELQTWLATATSQSYAAIQITDSANDIATGPLLCQIEPNQNDTGTTPTSANGTLSVAAGKTVTFPQSLTFPSALGTNGFQLTTDGAGALTWAAGTNAPGGSTTQVQYNNAGSFAGITGATTDGTALTLVAPVLGAATATSINGITITAGGSGTLTMVGSISTAASGGSINTSSSGGSISTAASGGSINTSYQGGDIDTSGDLSAGSFPGGSINTAGGVSVVGGSINTSDGGGAIDTTGNGSIGLGIAANRITLVGTTGSNGKTATFPNVTGTVAVAATSATATQALFAQATGFPAYRGIASADIATALLTPGPIGTTPNTGDFTTLTGTSSATLGVNGGTGGSLVLRGSTSGTATINTSPTGVLALPSGTTATSMALTTPVLGTPSSGVMNNLTGILRGLAAQETVSSYNGVALTGTMYFADETARANGTLTGIGTLFTTEAKVGDRIATASDGGFGSQSGPFFVKSIASNTSLTLSNSGNAGQIGSGNAVSAKIFRSLLTAQSETGLNLVTISADGTLILGTPPSALASGAIAAVNANATFNYVILAGNRLYSSGGWLALQTYNGSAQVDIGLADAGTTNTHILTVASTFSVTGATTLGGGTAIAKLRHGSATLVAGTKTVTDTAVTANSRIWINRFTDGGTLGDSYSITRSAGASFTITSKTANVTATLDTSVVSYLIIEP